MQKFYVYKMTVDNGGAPCVENDLLSLAICKPRLRSTCGVGDFVFGFGTNARDNPLIYIAEVTEKLTKGEYYAGNPRYSRRADCIYSKTNDGYVQNDNPFHDPGDLEHDLGPKEKGFPDTNVLLSTDFRYFGNKAESSYKAKYPKVKELVQSMKQGHRVNHPVGVEEELKRLKEEALRENGKMVIAAPRDKGIKKKCYEDDGETIVECR